MDFINAPMGKFVDLMYENRNPQKRQLLIRTISRYKDHFASSDIPSVEAFFEWYARRFEKEFNEEVRPHLEYLMKNMCVYFHFLPKDT